MAPKSEKRGRNEEQDRGRNGPGHRDIPRPTYMRYLHHVFASIWATYDTMSLRDWEPWLIWPREHLLQADEGEMLRSICRAPFRFTPVSAKSLNFQEKVVDFRKIL